MVLGTEQLQIVDIPLIPASVDWDDVVNLPTAGAVASSTMSALIPISIENSRAKPTPTTVTRVGARH